MGEVLSTLQKDLKENDDGTEESQSLNGRTLNKDASSHHNYTNANLGPIHFHGAHSDNVMLSHYRTKARRRNGINQAVCFSNRPIAINEKIRIRLTDISNDWYIALMFGITSSDPYSTSMPSLIEKPIAIQTQYWLDMLKDQYSERNYVLEFWFTKKGFIMYAVNGKTIGKSCAMPVNTDAQLWAVFDIVGRIVEIEFLTKEFDENRRIDYFDKEFDFTKRPPPPLFENGRLSDSALDTCKTIEEGFTMIVSHRILASGHLDPNYLTNTPTACEIQKEIAKNKTIWCVDKQQEMYHRVSNIQELLDALKKPDLDPIMRIYYRSQHIHSFDENNSPFNIQVYVQEYRINDEWIPHIQDAIAKINTAAPGINLVYTDKHLEEIENEIRIGILDRDDMHSAYTPLDNNLTYPCIHLGSDYPRDKMKGTSIHELLHAVGFDHQMNRFDADRYVDICTDDLSKEYAEQYKINSNYRLLTPFDPFSIMMYHENKNLKRKKGAKIWDLKEGPERSEDLSELDKVALNLMYKPCKSNSNLYSPKISETTNMLYCGRDVMQYHNQNVPPTLSIKCGPKLWANCPSCRVFKDFQAHDGNNVEIITIKKCLDKGKWQGLSGNFYCENKYAEKFTTFRFDTCIESDGVCGPDQGIPCTDCGKVLKPDYSYKDFKPIPTISCHIQN